MNNGVVISGVEESSEKPDGSIEDLSAPRKGEEEKIVPMHRQTKSLDETTSANNLNVPYKVKSANNLTKYV